MTVMPAMAALAALAALTALTALATLAAVGACKLLDVSHTFLTLTALGGEDQKLAFT
jgi:hypothetical protein